MDQPLISILIPVFNAGKYIAETLESIRKQTYQHWECILVDDISTDDSPSIIQKDIEGDPRFKFFIRPELDKKGANTCRNLAFKHAAGSWINWFDADDIMLPDFLLEKVSLIEPNLNMVITSGLYAHEDLSIIRQIDLFETEKLFSDFVLWKLKILTPSVMFRKDFLQKDALFLETLAYSEEAEFFSRIFFDAAPGSYQIKNIHSFLYRMNQSSASAVNRGYRKDFKNSEIFLLSENLRRGIISKDFEIASSMYRLLVNLMFKSIINRDSDNTSYIKKVLNTNLSSRNNSMLKALFAMATIHQKMPVRQLRWDAIFKRMKIKI